LEESVPPTRLELLFTKLRRLYQDFVGKFLEKKANKAINGSWENVKHNFKETYRAEGEISSKNLIAYHVIVAGIIQNLHSIEK